MFGNVVFGGLSLTPTLSSFGLCDVINDLETMMLSWMWRLRVEEDVGFIGSELDGQGQIRDTGKHWEFWTDVGCLNPKGGTHKAVLLLVTRCCLAWGHVSTYSPIWWMHLELHPRVEIGSRRSPLMVTLPSPIKLLRRSCSIIPT